MRTACRLVLVFLSLLAFVLTACANTNSAQTTAIPGQEPTPTIDWRARQVLTLSGTDDMATPSFEGVDAITSDREPIRIDFSLIYYVSPEFIPNIKPDQWEDYLKNTVIPILRDTTVHVVSGYEVREIFGEKRIDMENHLKTALETNLSDSRLDIVDFLIRDMQFSKAFAAKFEQEIILTLTAEARLPTSTPKGHVDPDR